MSELHKPIKKMSETRFFYEILALPKDKKRWTTLNKTTSYEMAKKTVEIKSKENLYTSLQINRVEKIKTFNLNRKEQKAHD